MDLVAFMFGAGVMLVGIGVGVLVSWMADR